MNPDAGIAEVPAFSATDALAGQWTPVPRALHRLVKNPSLENLDVITDLVKSIDESKLQPDEEKLWNEYSRRLLNDLQVARGQIHESPETAARMVDHAVSEAGRYVGLPSAPVAPPAVAPELAVQLKQLLADYHPLMQALAGDDDVAAQKAAEVLVSSVGTIDAPQSTPLKSLAAAVAAAPDIKSRRAAFQPLSEAIILLIRERGLDAVGNAYVVHCPMAFEGKGGDWLSDKPEVHNPYYGSMMLNCGDVTDTLSLNKQPPSLPTHSDH